MPLDIDFDAIDKAKQKTGLGIDFDALDTQNQGFASQAAEWAGKQGKGFLGGIATEAPKVAANVLSLAPRYLGKAIEYGGGKEVGQGLQSFANTIQAEGERQSAQQAANFQGYQEGGIGAFAGQLATQGVAAAAMPGGNAGKLATGLGEAANLGRGAKLFGEVVGSAADMARFGAVSKGEVTNEDIAMGASFPFAAKGVGVALSPVKSLLGAASKKLALAGLMNPAKLQAVNRALESGGDEIIQKEGDFANWMQSRGIVGSKEQIIDKLTQAATSAKAQLDKAIASVPGTLKSESVANIADDLYRQTPSVAGLANPMAERLSQLAAKARSEGLTLSEMNELKRSIDGTISIYKQSGIAADTKLADVWQPIRNQLKRDIEDYAAKNGVENVRALNNEIAISKTAADAISGKLAADEARVLLSPFVVSPLVGGAAGVAHGVATGQDPFTIVKEALVGAGIGLLNRTSVTSRLGLLLSKLTPGERGLFRAYLDSHGNAQLSPSLEKKLKDVAKPAKKPRLWDYESPKEKPTTGFDLFGFNPPAKPTGSLFTSTDKEAAKEYLKEMTKQTGYRKAYEMTEKEFGANAMEGIEKPKLNAAQMRAADEKEAAYKAFIDSLRNPAQAQAPASMAGETAEDIVKGWGSVPADVVEEYKGLSDRAKQHLLPYNPEKGVPLLPEKATEMPRSVQGIQSRSKKIELTDKKPKK